MESLTSRHIDRTPGTPGSDKHSHIKVFKNIVEVGPAHKRKITLLQDAWNGGQKVLLQKSRAISNIFILFLQYMVLWMLHIFIFPASIWFWLQKNAGLCMKCEMNIIYMKNHNFGLNHECNIVRNMNVAILYFPYSTLSWLERNTRFCMKYEYDFVQGVFLWLVPPLKVLSTDKLI